jgi:hypothetical protein
MWMEYNDEGHSTFNRLPTYAQEDVKVCGTCAAELEIPSIETINKILSNAYQNHGPDFKRRLEHQFAIIAEQDIDKASR